MKFRLNQGDFVNVELNFNWFLKFVAKNFTGYYSF